MDEDSQAKRLVNLLRDTGHDVVTANEANLMGQSDANVLDYARQEKRVVLTYNCNDFQVLHKLNSEHPGILAVYHNAKSLKDMVYQEIVKAIANIEKANFSLENQFVPLNQWNY